jgi:hypothetical protein
MGETMVLLLPSRKPAMLIEKADGDLTQNACGSFREHRRYAIA